jgi:hypothetical protein
MYTKENVKLGKKSKKKSQHRRILLLTHQWQGALMFVKNSWLINFNYGQSKWFCAIKAKNKRENNIAKRQRGRRTQHNTVEKQQTLILILLTILRWKAWQYEWNYCGFCNKIVLRNLSGWKQKMNQLFEIRMNYKSI